MIELLLQCGAHIADGDLKHVCEMMTRAIKCGNIKRIESLKKAGADLDTPDELLQTPLHKVWKVFIFVRY